MRKLLKNISTIAIILVVLMLILRACSEVETRRTQIDSLKPGQINSTIYPWSSLRGLITSVKNYREAYDMDSTEWVAEFVLLPSEARKLAGHLQPLPHAKKAYRCQSSLANWGLKNDICDAKEMRSKGFVGYFYNPSFCKAGCKQDIILWVHEESGRSFIVGGPDYD